MNKATLFSDLETGDRFFFKEKSEILTENESLDIIFSKVSDGSAYSETTGKIVIDGDVPVSYLD